MCGSILEEIDLVWKAVRFKRTTPASPVVDKWRRSRTVCAGNGSLHNRGARVGRTEDIDQVHRLWDWLDDLRASDGLAVLFSTQSVDEAARHARRMVVLNHGHVVFRGTAGELVARHGSPGVAEADAADRAFLNLVGPPA